MNLQLDLQFGQSLEQVPDESEFKRWAQAALEGRREIAELLIRIVDTKEITELNKTYRGKNQSTNVLSFPFEPPAPIESDLLGDVVICASVVQREAAELKQPEEMHWAHMVVHGVLHLLGYDHQDDEQAGEMEGLEVKILGGLGYPDPYYCSKDGVID